MVRSGKVVPLPESGVRWFKVLDGVHKGRGNLGWEVGGALPRWS